MDTQAVHPRRLTTILISFFFTTFIAVTYGFGVYLFPAILTDMKADLGLTYTQIGMITGLSQAGFLIASLGSGFLTTFIGGGVLIIVSVFICGLCLTGLAFSSNSWLIGAQLTLLRACSAMAWVPMVAVVGRWIAFQNRSKVFGLISSGTSYGVFINGLIVPYFILYHHWRDIWLATGLGTLALTATSFFCLRRVGVLDDDADTPAEVLPRRRGIRLPFTPTVWIILIIFFLLGLAYIPFQTYLSPYLREELGMGVEVAGGVWSLIGFVGMGGGFLMGLLSDRIGIRPVMILTYALTIVAAGVLYLSAGPVWLLIAGAAFGLAFYALFGITPAYIAKVFPPDQAGLLFGVANVSMGAGCMIGNFMGGWSKTATGTFIWVYVSVGALAMILIPISCLLPLEHADEPAADTVAATGRRSVRDDTKPPGARIDERPVGCDHVPTSRSTFST
jgi:predicted MFS family arabinose efflux permease